MNIHGDGEEECIKHYLLMQTPTRLACIVVYAYTDWAQWFFPQLLSQRKSSCCLCQSLVDKNLWRNDAWSV